MLRIFKKGPPQSHQRAEDDIVELDVWRFHHQDAVGLLTCGWLVCRLTSHQEFDEKKNQLRKMFSPGDSQKLQPQAGQPPEAQGTPSPVPRLAAPVPGFMDGDCSHEIRRHLLLGRKAITNLDSILKSRDITANKGPCSQSYGFPVVTYRCENWSIKKAECQRIDAFESVLEKGTLLQCWWECKLVQPQWRTVWRFLKKLEIELLYNPAIPLLGIHIEETRIERDMCTPMFIKVLFTIARTWKQPRCL